MNETQLRLDGNAAAGILREIFLHEMSAARSACASCGTIAQIGSQILYMYPPSPGAVLRCYTCQDFLMVFVRAGGRTRLGLRGLAWLEMPDAAEAPAAQIGHVR
jgi:hypothetical protein